MPGFSIYQGGIVAGNANASSPAACCALCLGDYKDECAGWEWVNHSLVPVRSHDCDIMAKIGVPTQVKGRVSGIVGSPPPSPPSPGPPPPPQTGTPCHSDGDCESLWATPNWRCLSQAVVPGPRNSCHMHDDTTNSTCTCLPSDCGGGIVGGGGNASTRLFVIGDSISEGMFSPLEKLMAPDGWSLQHSPGNGDNTNYGSHCVPSWVPLSSGYGPFDVISFQFGLHDIAYDEERLSVEQYTRLLTNITAHLTEVQRQHGTKLLWVKTTPVPTVPAFGAGCNGSATVCLNPARYDRDVVLYNAAADKVMAAAANQGAKIGTADLYSFVLDKCGGKPGYASCPGFQLPNNVHYTPEGWDALAGEMRTILLS